jgi:hypothetical protein
MALMLRRPRRAGHARLAHFAPAAIIRAASASPRFSSADQYRRLPSIRRIRAQRNRRPLTLSLFSLTNFDGPRRPQLIAITNFDGPRRSELVPDPPNRRPPSIPTDRDHPDRRRLSIRRIRITPTTAARRSRRSSIRNIATRRRFPSSRPPREKSSPDPRNAEKPRAISPSHRPKTNSVRKESAPWTSRFLVPKP